MNAWDNNVAADPLDDLRRGYEAMRRNTGRRPELYLVTRRQWYRLLWDKFWARWRRRHRPWWAVGAWHRDWQSWVYSRTRAKWYRRHAGANDW